MKLLLFLLCAPFIRCFDIILILLLFAPLVSEMDEILVHCANWVPKIDYIFASMATNGSVYNMVSFWFVILLVQPFIEGKHLNLMSIASIFVYFFILKFSQWIESMLLGCFSRCFCILSEKFYVRINTDRPTSLRIKEIIYGDFVEICFIIKLMWNMLIEWQLYA